MRVEILTIFPEMIQAAADFSIVKRAREKGALRLETCNIRDFSHDKHRSTDDYPYGGGAGMVMKPDVVFEAAESIMASEPGNRPHVVLTTPQGRPLNQEIVRDLAGRGWLMIICGHYEGIDERIREHLIDDEISIGDYILTGGELPALVILDAVTRLLPGVLGAEESAVEESFSEDGLLEYPHYTRPADFRGWAVPEVLLSGNHAEIAKWRRRQSLKRTLERRPDLLQRARLTDKDKRILAELKEDYDADN
ncbi:MAG: tRNA (guanosine(37)-N1)-methyltransferase TrmD [Armatimonadota bacterium]|nr:tRNA (guanosine(37)-N1)-methyltransferase TrmD [Armatimonadota bacterium]